MFNKSKWLGPFGQLWTGRAGLLMQGSVNHGPSAVEEAQLVYHISNSKWCMNDILVGVFVGFLASLSKETNLYTLDEPIFFFSNGNISCNFYGILVASYFKCLVGIKHHKFMLWDRWIVWIRLRLWLLQVFFFFFNYHFPIAEQFHY